MAEQSDAQTAGRALSFQQRASHAIERSRSGGARLEVCRRTINERLVYDHPKKNAIWHVSLCLLVCQAKMKKKKVKNGCRPSGRAAVTEGGTKKVLFKTQAEAAA